MRVLQFSVAIVIFAASIFFYMLTFSFPPGTSVDPGPAYYPRLVLGFVMGLTVIYAVQVLRGKIEKAIFSDREKANGIMLLSMVGLVCLFVLLFGKVPFFILAPVALFVICLSLKMTWKLSAITAMILSITVYLMFVKGFQVML